MWPVDPGGRPGAGRQLPEQPRRHHLWWQQRDPARDRRAFGRGRLRARDAGTGRRTADDPRHRGAPGARRDGSPSPAPAATWPTRPGAWPSSRDWSRCRSPRPTAVSARGRRCCARSRKNSVAGCRWAASCSAACWPGSGSRPRRPGPARSARLGGIRRGQPRARRRRRGTGRSRRAGPRRTAGAADGARFVLDGAKCNVWLHADTEALLVTAVTDAAAHDLMLLEVPRNAPGLVLREFATVDDGRAARRGVQRRGRGAWRACWPAPAAVSRPRALRAWDLVLLAEAAECVGLMKALLQRTSEYLAARKQFGQPLSKLQVLRHRLADMALARFRAAALVAFAAREFEGLAAAERFAARRRHALQGAGGRTLRGRAGGAAARRHGRLGRPADRPPPASRTGAGGDPGHARLPPREIRGWRAGMMPGRDFAAIIPR